MSDTRVLGVVGWSGSGKTVLIAKLIPLLIEQGLAISTLKHAHHGFEVDQPGKDSYEHRKAGASEVIVSSSRRWVQMHELGGAEAEATLAQLLRRLSPCDLVLVEGFKTQRHPKMEVFRQALGLRPLHLRDRRIVAVAADQPFPGAGVPVVDLNNIAAIAELVRSHAEPLGAVVAMLEGQASSA
ncbi:MAG: molybdopterin-guanine dinucleotide biosynthesis protein B [Steroidobacteraceae bacterium]